MKFLCLAYGDEKDWIVLSKEQQREMLAQDEALRKMGTLMAAVEKDVTKVRAWNGNLEVTKGAFAQASAPLAGFSIIEAANVDEVARLVAGTPCARAKGWIEIRPILAINDDRLVSN
jgi:hypothetical protein